MPSGDAIVIAYDRDAADNQGDTLPEQGSAGKGGASITYLEPQARQAARVPCIIFARVGYILIAPDVGIATLNLDSTKFCPHCGGPLKLHRVGGELRNHSICVSCGVVHYESPMLVVKCFVFCRNRLLWVRRGIEPRYGLWSIPGGFLENGETLVQGAVREVWEEAGVQIDEHSLEYYMTGAVTFVNQVHVAFRTTVDSFECQPGTESLDCRFFTRDECPWDAMAYPEVSAAMVQAYDDLESGSYGIWSAELSVGGYNRRLVKET